MKRCTQLAGLAGFLALVLGWASACGEAPDSHTHVPEDGDTSPVVIDWDARQVSFHSPDWDVEFCEGEGPFLCVARAGEHMGSVELLRLPVDRHTAITRVLDRGGTELEALEAVAADLVAGLSADRRVGMGEDYQMRAEPTAAVAVMGKQGLRLVVEGGSANRVQERIVHYYVIHRDSLYLLGATGVEGGGPLGEFATDDLRAFEPVLGRIAAASRVSATAP